MPFLPTKVRTNRENSDLGITRGLINLTSAGGGEERAGSIQMPNNGKVGEIQISSDQPFHVTVYNNSSDAVGGTEIGSAYVAAYMPYTMVFTVPESIARGRWVVVSADAPLGADVTGVIRGWSE